MGACCWEVFVMRGSLNYYEPPWCVYVCQILFLVVLHVSNNTHRYLPFHCRLQVWGVWEPSRLLPGCAYHMWGGSNGGRRSGQEDLRYVEEQTTVIHTQLKVTSTSYMWCRHKVISSWRSSEFIRVPLANEVAANMIDNYRQSELYGENDRKLQKSMEALLEREQRGVEREVISATYATNFLWQVRAWSSRKTEWGLYSTPDLFQMCVVSIRSTVTIVRNPLSFLFLVGAVMHVSYY